MTKTLLHSFVRSFKTTARRASGIAVATATGETPECVSQPMMDNSPQVRHILQAVSDLARKPLKGLRILDLACAHGGYSLELAAMGADVLGIEGRAEWLRLANQRKQDASFTNVDFVQDDVRNLSRKKYGEFDIVLCLGILYHIDAPDVFDLVENVAEVCRDFAILETHFAPHDLAYRSHAWRGKQYHGASYREHSPQTDREAKLANLGASLDNDLAFWFTEASLCNILSHVGFTSVHEVRNPVPNVYVGPEREVKIWGNRITLAAIKGQPVTLRESPGMPATPVDWPENKDDCLLEDLLIHARPIQPGAS
jgi:SAM-dependent methyltransferase